MKLPIWAKTRDDKWAVFPFERLTTFNDGKKGFWWPVVLLSHDDLYPIYDRFRNHFEFSPSNDALPGLHRVVLKENK